MKKIEISNRTFCKIKDGQQTQIILNDVGIQNKDIITLSCDNDILEAEITAKMKYDSLDDCFKIIPFDLFGFDNLDDALKSYKDMKRINVYRIKVDNNNIEKITDEELLDLLDINTLKKNNVGHSNTNVYEVKTKQGKDAILKIQHLTNRNDLSEEYNRIKWLQNKFIVPKIYYYKTENDIKYLLMEKLDGVSAHKYEGFAYKIGEALKMFHNIDITNCKFKQNSIEILIKIALNNIDIIYPQVYEEYPEMTKKDVMSFIKNNAPKDKILVHGDYSLPNILINSNGQVGVIDLGDVSISSKYFDFFYLNKSLKRNRQQDKLNELLKGYGIDKLDDKYMKWVEIIDKALF